MGNSIYTLKLKHADDTIEESHSSIDVTSNKTEIQTMPLYTHCK